MSASPAGEGVGVPPLPPLSGRTAEAPAQFACRTCSFLDLLMPCHCPGYDVVFSLRPREA
eukprot:6938470-Pyramimonas_sp.AAC.1